MTPIVLYICGFDPAWNFICPVEKQKICNVIVKLNFQIQIWKYSNMKTIPCINYNQFWSFYAIIYIFNFAFFYILQLCNF